MTKQSENIGKNIITSISFQDPVFCVVINKKKYYLDIETFNQLQLMPQQIIDLEKFLLIQKESNLYQTKQRIIHHLASSYLSNKEIQNKLGKNISKKELNDFLKFLNEAGLVDEEEQSRQLIQYYQSMLYGELYIQHRLKEKGLENYSHLIIELLDHSQIDGQIRQIIAKAKQQYHNLSFWQKRQKIHALLERRGFNHFSSLINELITYDQDVEENGIKNYLRAHPSLKEEALFDVLTRLGYNKDAIKNVLRRNYE